MAETCDDLSEYLVEEELSRDVESLKAILASDADSEDHTRGGKNCNSIGDNAATSEEQYSSAVPLDQLLRCNEKVQQSLRKQLKDIDEALRRNREHQARLNTIATLSRAKLFANSFTLKVFTRSRSYFFQKAQDQPALYNAEDCVGSNSLFSSRDLAWSAKQEKNLIKGLRRQALDLRIHKLQSNGSQSTKKLKEAIKAISSLPDEELLKDTSEVNWQVISLEEFNNQCLQADLKLRWMNHLHFDINHSEWTKEEDKKLLRLAKEQNYRNWVAIAKDLKTNRTAFLCLQRYQQFLNADMINSYTRWTEQEDNALRDAVAKFGHNWAAVSAHLNTNRSSQQCLHRWRYSLAPGSKRGRWDQEEDDALRKGVELCGVGNWSRIASIVQTRNAVQCRERWVNVLDSNIQRGTFTREEDAKLLQMCQQYEGLIPWAEVAAKLGNRTDNMCARRWKQLSSTAEVMTQYSKRVKQGALRPHTITKTTKHKRTAIVPEEMEDDLMPNSIKKILEVKQKNLMQKESVKRRPRQHFISSSLGASASELHPPTTLQPPSPSPVHQTIQLPLADLQASSCPSSGSRGTSDTLSTSRSALGWRRRCSVRRPSLRQNIPTCPVDSVQDMVLAQEGYTRGRNDTNHCTSIPEVSDEHESLLEQAASMPQSPLPSEDGHVRSSSSSLLDKMPSELEPPPSSELEADSRGQYSSQHLPPSMAVPRRSSMAQPDGQCLPELRPRDGGHSPSGLGVDNGGQRTRDEGGQSEMSRQSVAQQARGERPVASVQAQVAVEVQAGEGRLNLEFESKSKRINAILPMLDRAIRLVAQECEIPAPPVIRCVNPIYAQGGSQREQATTSSPAGSTGQGSGREVVSPASGTAAAATLAGSGGHASNRRPLDPGIVEVILH
ncbi:hypothetical protein EMCRGX_G029854 [Ephydatia muelleri]